MRVKNISVHRENMLKVRVVNFIAHCEWKFRGILRHVNVSTITNCKTRYNVPQIGVGSHFYEC